MVNGQSGSNSLSKNSIGLTGMIMITIAGVLAIIGPLETAAFIGDAGEAAIWPVILGFVLFALVSLPILEYTRIAPFAGGYYGLAELGFGKGAGKFTSLSNYFFYNFWQMANAFFIAFLAVDTIYYLYNILLPFWTWILFGVITLILTYVVSVMRAKNLGRVIVGITIPTLVLVVAFIIYVIVKSPYNSAAVLNPANSSSGISGIFLATAVLGFYLFAGYGASIFFGEEGVKARKNLWRAVYIGLSISAVVIAISVYSELVAIPRGDLSIVSAAANPQLVTWTHYFPISVLMAFNMIVLVVSMASYAAGGGSQARLLWAMARDGFIKSKWLKELNPRTGVPSRTALVNFVLALVTFISVASLLAKFYGYNPQTVVLGFFVAGTTSTILWYFHHFIPEFGLFSFLHKHKEIKYSKNRRIVAGLVVPIAGTALFIFTFYEGIIGDLVEPYFAFVILATIIVIGTLLYTYYKKRTGTLGESTVEYMAAESGRTFNEAGDSEK
jgi:amino acid transporter